LVHGPSLATPTAPWLPASPCYLVPLSRFCRPVLPFAPPPFRSWPPRTITPFVLPHCAGRRSSLPPACAHTRPADPPPSYKLPNSPPLRITPPRFPRPPPSSQGTLLCPPCHQPSASHFSGAAVPDPALPRDSPPHGFAGTLLPDGFVPPTLAPPQSTLQPSRPLHSILSSPRSIPNRAAVTLSPAQPPRAPYSPRAPSGPPRSPLPLMLVPGMPPRTLCQAARGPGPPRRCPAPRAAALRPEPSRHHACAGSCITAPVFFSLWSCSFCPASLPTPPRLAPLSTVAPPQSSSSDVIRLSAVPKFHRCFWPAPVSSHLFCTSAPHARAEFYVVFLSR